MGSEDGIKTGRLSSVALKKKDETTRKKNQKTRYSSHSGDSDWTCDLGCCCSLFFSFPTKTPKMIQDKTATFPLLAPINLRSAAIVFKCNFPKMEEWGIYSCLKILLEVV